jgi:hypothetical protein
MKVSQLRFVFALLLASVCAAQEEGGNWKHARDVITRAMTNLRHIDHRAGFAGGDRDRYDRTMRSLSDVERSLADGRFDKNKLDEAIQNLDHVTRGRELDPADREHVLDDLKDLRRLREEWR